MLLYVKCVVAYGGIIIATDQTLKNVFLRLAVRWDNRSEAWFKAFCILVRPHTQTQR